MRKDTVDGTKEQFKKFNNSGAGFLTAGGLYNQSVEKPAMMRREGGQLANQERAIANTQIKMAQDNATKELNDRGAIARRALMRRQSAYGTKRTTLLGSGSGGKTLLGA